MPPPPPPPPPALRSYQRTPFSLRLGAGELVACRSPINNYAFSGIKSVLAANGENGAKKGSQRLKGSGPLFRTLTFFCSLGRHGRQSYVREARAY